MSKRLLTENEIENIVNNLDKVHFIPPETALSVENKIKNDIRDQLKTILIYPKLIPLFKKEINKFYQKTLISPGESVGIITAQSIGERQTQMTLNTFHSAGMAVKTVITGVPRFSELLNATKDPKAISANIYFKNSNSNISQLRKKIGSSLVGFTIKSLILSYEICLDKKAEEWYKFCELIYNKKKKFDHCISFKMNIEKLYEYSINLNSIAQKIENEFDDLICIFSSIEIGRIDIFVDINSIILPEENNLYVNEGNYINIYFEEVVLTNLFDLYLCGIPAIKNIFYCKKEDEWIVESEGCDFQKLLAHPDIDLTRTVCNHMWDIYKVLGIEAAREFLIEEFINVVSSDGTYINDRHIKLLVDVMTFSGTITSISRYGMKREHTGALAKASFEESLDNFLKAGVFGDVEATNGVSASIMCGKRAKMGTGMFDLCVDLENLNL